jgi:hypothetical protein
MLRATGVPDDLVGAWGGHANTRTKSLHTHFQDDFRRQFASQVSLFHSQTWQENCRMIPVGPKFLKMEPISPNLQLQRESLVID